jgi:4,5-DOPA dioxygenase extradiol
MFPSIFLSHGSPAMLLSDSPVRDFLSGLGRSLGKPEAILVASAHWETAAPALNAVAVSGTIHDFGGFPAPLYAMQYLAPGSPALAEKAAALLQRAGSPAHIDTRRGLDHGAWVPLMLAYPGADIPVVQLSVQPHRGPAHHLAVGRALAPLREEGVLIIGSGGFTHNLHEYLRGAASGAEPEWVTEFADWFGHALTEHRLGDLPRYRELAPHPERNHPTDEHLLPLYTALGAGGGKPRIERIHASSEGTVLRLDAYAFT